MTALEFYIVGIITGALANLLVIFTYFAFRKNN